MSGGADLGHLPFCPHYSSADRTSGEGHMETKDGWMEARAPSTDSTFENAPFPTAQQMSLKPRSYQIGAGSVKRAPGTGSLHPPTQHHWPLAGLCGGGGVRATEPHLGVAPATGRCLPHPACPSPRGTVGSQQGSPMAHTCGLPRREGPRRGDGRRGCREGCRALGELGPTFSVTAQTWDLSSTQSTKNVCFQTKKFPWRQGKMGDFSLH